MPKLVSYWPNVKRKKRKSTEAEQVEDKELISHKYAKKPAGNPNFSSYFTRYSQNGCSDEVKKSQNK